MRRVTAKLGVFFVALFSGSSSTTLSPSFLSIFVWRFLTSSVTIYVSLETLPTWLIFSRKWVVSLMYDGRF